MQNDERAEETWYKYYDEPYSGDPSNWVKSINNYKFLSSECNFGSMKNLRDPVIFIDGDGSCIQQKTCAFKSKGKYLALLFIRLLRRSEETTNIFKLTENSYIDCASLQGEGNMIDGTSNKSISYINCSKNNAQEIPTFYLGRHDEGCFTDMSFCTFSNNLACEMFLIEIGDQAKSFRCNFVHNILGDAGWVLYCE